MSACPFLGLEDDASLMLSEASPQHRCYGAKPHRSPAIGYQEANCLVDNHVTCPVFKLAGARQAQERASAMATASTQQKRRTPLVLASLAGVAALIAIVFSLSGQIDVLSFAGIENLLGIEAEATGVSTVASEVAPFRTPVPVEENVNSEALASATFDAADAAISSDVDLVPLGDQDSIDASSQIAGATDAAADPTEAVVPTSTPTPSATFTSTATPTDSAAQTSAAALSDTATPATAATPENAGAEQQGTSVPDVTTPVTIMDTPTPTTLRLTPAASDVGWLSSDSEITSWGDSFLYAGQLDDATLISGLLFDLSRIARGAPIYSGSLEIVGLTDSRLNPDLAGAWRVQLIAQKELSQLRDASFMMLYSAPASITTLRDLTAQDLRVGATNTWELDKFELEWLQQQVLDGATSVIVRIVRVAQGNGNSVFAWDSGYGSQSNGDSPMLRLAVGRAPATPPPLATRDYLVATFTPVPQNVLTVVAQQQTATVVATTIGTYTPVPPFITPTPPAKDLATLQARADVLGLPAVAVHTPTPESAAEATQNAEYATAIALTTGTYTPVPAGFVTPFVVPPSPPAQSVETEIARIAEATAFVTENRDTPTPAPHNMLVGEWITATPTPANVATAAALSLEATRSFELSGRPTATPFHWLVITATPTPLPTLTPTTAMVILESDFTPTPIPPPTEAVPVTLPDEYKGQILFKRGAGAFAQDWIYNPATQQSGLVTRDWLYPLARTSLPLSPNGQEEVFVRTNNNGIPEIFIRTVGSSRDRKLTNFPAPSYDPAWSPDGKWIAFVSSNSGNDEIYRVTTDGAILEQLTHNNWEWDKHPSWSPDSSQIVFFSNRDVGRTQIWIMNADGSGQKRLIESEAEDAYPIWAR